MITLLCLPVNVAYFRVLVNEELEIALVRWDVIASPFLCLWAFKCYFFWGCMYLCSHIQIQN